MVVDILVGVTGADVSNFWVQVAAGIVVFLLTASLNRWFRQHVWRPVGRAIARIASIRVTTTGRRQRERDEMRRLEERSDSQAKALQSHATFFDSVCDELRISDGRSSERVLKQINALRDYATRMKQRAEMEVEAVKALAKLEASEAEKRHRIDVEDARSTAYDEGREHERRAIEAERAKTPLLIPRWRIAENGFGRVFALSNMQSGVEVRDVSLWPVSNDFDFHGDNQWPGPFDGSVAFTGRRTETAFPIQFRVEYRDADGDSHEDYCTLQSEW